MGFLVHLEAQSLVAKDRSRRGGGGAPVCTPEYFPLFPIVLSRDSHSLPGATVSTISCSWDSCFCLT